MSSSPYINCDFILGSSAEVERMWSTASLILTLPRAGMYPITMEAILYLKYNRDWWGIVEVNEAMNMDNTELREEFIEDIEYHEDDQSEC